MLTMALITPAIIPFDCARPLLADLTPFLLDGSNRFLTDFITTVAPFVLP